MINLRNLKIIISGITQGVGFRPFVYRLACDCNLSGYIQNQADGVVEIFIQGNRKDMDLFLRKIKEEKPILAEYMDIDIQEHRDDEITYHDFLIIESSNYIKKSGSSIHPDVSICNKCITEFLLGKTSQYYLVREVAPQHDNI